MEILRQIDGEPEGKMFQYTQLSRSTLSNNNWFGAKTTLKMYPIGLGWVRPE